ILTLKRACELAPGQFEWLLAYKQAESERRSLFNRPGGFTKAQAKETLAKCLPRYEECLRLKPGYAPALSSVALLYAFAGPDAQHLVYADRLVAAVPY